MEILDEDTANEEFLIEKLNAINPSYKDANVYSALLRVFTSMEIPEEEASVVWAEIVEYKRQLTAILNRDVGFRVAMLDYFININKKLINPKLIEIRLFAETEKLVLIDELTKLYNRRHFQSSLQREFKQALRYKQPLSLLIIDIDNFKKINDTYGHPKGDEILVQVAMTINANTRMEDTACRIGGEEFAIILPHTDEASAMIAAQKLLEGCRKIEYDGKFVTVSGGIVSFPDKADSVNKLYDFADRALYNAKYSGKDKIVPYSADKRGSLRFAANLELSCLQPDKSFKTISKNLSITGIAFETEEQIELNDLLDVRLRDETSGHEIEAKIKIVRKETSANQVFHIGAEFVELKSQYRELLKGISMRKDPTTNLPIK
jgi:diguanylate cyclase (GGDEF)-like protein